MSYSQLVLSEKPYGYWDCAALQSGQLEDLTSFNNHATLSNVLTNRKPIIYGPGACIKLLENSTVTIDNTYKLFFRGAESKSASVEFFFSIPESANNPHQILQIGNFLKCYVIADKIYIESGNKIASIQIDTWEKTQYVCIRYGSNSINLSLNNIDPVSINLGDNFIFPDTTPPDLVFGPSAGQSTPLYLNAIAIYTYLLIKSEMLMRQSWSTYSSKAENLAIANNADLINPSVDSIKPNFSYSISDSSRFLEGQFSNIVVKDNHITLPNEPPVEVDSLDGSNSYNLDLDGISFSGDSYININSAYKYFSGNNNIIRMQIDFDGLSTKQTILNIGPFLDRTSLSLYKSTNNTVVLSTINSSGTETVLSESQSLGSVFTEYFDVSLTILDGYITLIVNENDQDPEIISYTSSEFDFYLGNAFDFESPLTSKIKNFSIDSYSAGEDIIYTNTGNYTLKFNNSLSVSQRGTWNYRLPIPINSISSLITYNYASKNAQLFVNGSLIETTSLIPNISYQSENILNIEVELKTDDSFNNPCVFSGLFVSTYDSTDLASANGIYRISAVETLQSNTFLTTNPYVLRYNRTSVLERPKNLGIKFNATVDTLGDYLDDLQASAWTVEQSIITSGANLIINDTSVNNSVDILEFIIQLDRIPSPGEIFSIFDVSGSSVELSYSNSGLVLGSGYSLFIDGTAATNGQDLEEGEFYHFLIKFNSPVSSIIRLGINNEKTQGLDGSMGLFAVHSQSPTDLNNYLSSRYNAIIGRPFISKIDSDIVNITDLPQASQTKEYSEDGKYFAMGELPKIKIVQNKWLTVK